MRNTHDKTGGRKENSLCDNNSTNTILPFLIPDPTELMGTQYGKEILHCRITHFVSFNEMKMVDYVRDFGRAMYLDPKLANLDLKTVRKLIPDYAVCLQIF